MGRAAPRPGHGDTGDLREHHGHRAALVTDLRSPRKRPRTVGRAAVVASSPHAAVPVLPRGLQEGQVLTGDRLPPVPLLPSFPPSGSDGPPEGSGVPVSPGPPLKIVPGEAEDPRAG